MNFHPEMLFVARFQVSQAVSNVLGLAPPLARVGPAQALGCIYSARAGAVFADRRERYQKCGTIDTVGFLSRRFVAICLGALGSAILDAPLGQSIRHSLLVGTHDRSSGVLSATIGAGVA